MLSGIALVAACLAAYRSFRAAQAEMLACNGDLIEATRLAPQNARYWVELANTKELRDPAAEDALDRARRLNPYDAGNWIQSGLRAEARGEIERAEAFLLHAESLTRQCGPQPLLANFYFRRGNRDLFWPRVKRALACTTDERRPLFDLCWSFSNDAGFLLREAIPKAAVIRRDFLEYLLRKNLLDGAEHAGAIVAGSAGPADREVLLRYTERMAEAGRWDAALAAWNTLCERKILPYAPLDRERGPWLTNGMWTSAPLNAGFDWHIRAVDGVSGFRTRSPNALRLEFSGKQPEQCEVLRQFVPVSPLQSYTLQVAHTFSEVAPHSGLSLQVADAESGTEIAAAELNGNSTRLSFQVPGRVARISLWYRRTPGTPRIEGSISIAGVRWEAQP